MRYFKIFAHARHFLLDLGDGRGATLLGFYTGRCVAAADEADAKKRFCDQLFDELAVEYGYARSDKDAPQIDIEELEEGDHHDEDLNTGKAFYLESSRK